MPARGPALKGAGKGAKRGRSSDGDGDVRGGAHRRHTPGSAAASGGANRRRRRRRRALQRAGGGSKGDRGKAATLTALL